MSGNNSSSVTAKFTLHTDAVKSFQSVAESLQRIAHPGVVPSVESSLETPTFGLRYKSGATYWLPLDSWFTPEVEEDFIDYSDPAVEAFKKLVKKLPEIEESIKTTYIKLHTAMPDLKWEKGWDEYEWKEWNDKWL